MNKYFFLLVLFLSNHYLSYAQPDIQWQKSLGGSNGEWAKSIQQTTDGGYIAIGHTLSFGTMANHDIYVVKTDNVGNVTWSKTFGGSGNDYARVLQVPFDPDGMVQRLRSPDVWPVDAGEVVQDFVPRIV